MRGGQGTGSFGGGGIVPAIDFSEAALSEELIRCRELIMAMERENAALRADAERYRWLRENKAHNNTHCWHFQGGPIIPALLTLDSAIDAAREGK